MEQQNVATSHKSKATMADVARLANVSIATVSYVLNNVPKPISDDTRERVWHAVDLLDYTPNSVAQRLAVGRSHTIGVFFSSTADLYFPNVLPAGLIGELRRGAMSAGFDLNLVLGASGLDSASGAELGLQLLRQRQVEGAVLLGPWCVGDNVGHFAGQSVVVIGNVAHPDINATWADRIQGFRDATTHLLALGHRRIALVTPHPSLVLSRDAMIGYREALNATGVKFDQHLVASPDIFNLGLTNRTVFELTLSLLRDKPYPDAFLIHGPIQGALAAFASVGLKIPGDVSVIACGNDNEPAEFTFPACSHLVYRQARVGHIAIQLLLDVIGGRVKNQTVKVPVTTRVVYRDSVAPNKG